MTTLPVPAAGGALAVAGRTAPVIAGAQLAYEMALRFDEALDKGEFGPLYETRPGMQVSNFGAMLGQAAASIGAPRPVRLGEVASRKRLPPPPTKAQPPGQHKEEPARMGWQPPFYRMRHGGVLSQPPLMEGDPTRRGRKRRRR